MQSLKNFLKTPSAALLVALALTDSACGQEFEYPSVDSNVSYSQVVNLPSRDADRKITYGSGEFQFGKLWEPSTATDKHLLVILIHGGCWLNQFDMTHTYPLATALSQEGYRVWSLEYRRTGDVGGGWPGTFEDIKKGVVRGQTIDFDNGATNGFAIIGHSAGGHLALLAGAESPSASIVIGLAAITDINLYAKGSNDCETATQSFMGANADDEPDLYTSANPAQNPMHSNTVLLHGTADAIVNLSQAALPEATTKTASNAGHFDWVHPGTPAYNLLLKTLEASL